MDLGAWMCCDSAHKTLPCLTGAAYLHLSPTAPSSLAAAMESAMKLLSLSSKASWGVMGAFGAAGAAL